MLIFSHSLVILYQILTTMSSYFRSFFSSVNIKDQVLLTIYDFDSFDLVCLSCGLNVTVHIHLLSIHSSTVINNFLYTFHHLSIFRVVRFWRSGKESNLTQPMVIHRTTFLLYDIETHGASTISTPCHAVRIKKVRKSSLNPT